MKTSHDSVCLINTDGRVEAAYHIKHNVMEAVYTQDFVLSLIVIWDEQWWGNYPF